MGTRRYELDMSQGSILKSMVRFVLPLILTNVLQILYNAADLVVVSRWTGSEAMASVGATSSLTALFTNIFIGFSLGAGIVVSRKFGARDNEGIHRAVHTAILLSLLVGFIAFLLGMFLSRPLLLLMETPKGTVLNGAVLYMKILAIGMPASLIYNFGASILRALGDTKRPLYILGFSGVINVLLNLLLVIKFHLGVAGVAIATVVAHYLSMFAVLYALMGSEGAYRLVLKELRFYKKELFDIISVGIPAGVQSSFFSLSNMVIQSAVNSFGTAAIVGGTAASNIENFVYTAMNAFYQATITAISQNYGAKNEKRVYQSIYIPAICAAVVGFVLGLLVIIFADPLLKIYITDSPEAMEYGFIKMLYMGVPYFFCGIMEVLVGALRGFGYSTVSAINSLVGACGLRIFWVKFILPLHRTIGFLYLSWPVSWVLVILANLTTLFIIRKRVIKRMYEAE
ncbi:MAG: MATE family efflux transporter [Clostridia bacterium]|nr:MATE family efflux transporter [Clostridia bacterium]